MSWWFKFNLVIFLIIVILTLLLRLLGNSGVPAPLRESPSPSPMEHNAATESAIFDPEVLGITTDSTQAAAVASLQVYESPQLRFMTMVPGSLLLTADTLQLKPSEEAVAHTFAQCTFTPVTPTTSIVIEESALDEQSLPLITYQRLAPEVATSETVTTVYIIKDEEEVAQLQLNCTQDWPVSEDFYSLLRAVRFL